MSWKNVNYKVAIHVHVIDRYKLSHKQIISYHAVYFQIVVTSASKEKEKSPKTAKVIVKKMKPESELNKPKPKM